MNPRVLAGDGAEMLDRSACFYRAPVVDDRHVQGRFVEADPTSRLGASSYS